MNTRIKISLALAVVLNASTAGFGQTGEKAEPETKASKPVPFGLQDLFGRGPGDATSGDPDAARLITTDIQNFWRAYDKATPHDLAEVLEREYLQPGSPGLKDFVRLRIKNADALARAIESHPGYYASIRESTLRVTAMEKRIRASFYALKHLDPDAVFPDVYFVIGRLNTGGTTSGRGLLIGTEMYGRTPQAPERELNEWHNRVLISINNVPLIVAHELIHFQQKPPATLRAGLLALKSRLLAQSIVEGGADFFGELVSGDHINQHLHTYGNAREKQLWEEFRNEMDNNDLSRWLYNGSTTRNRPADLGYYIGYKIVESYCGQVKDKKKAIKEFLSIEDYSKFLKDSAYEAKFKEQPGEK